MNSSGTQTYYKDFIKVVQPKLDKYIHDSNNIPVISTMEEYDAIP